MDSKTEIQVVGMVWEVLDVVFEGLVNWVGSWVSKVVAENQPGEMEVVNESWEGWGSADALGSRD